MLRNQITNKNYGPKKINQKTGIRISDNNKKQYTKLVTKTVPTKQIVPETKTVPVPVPETKTVPVPHWKTKKGWKTKLIKMLFKNIGGSIKRTTLSKMIHSDERNTHILISCIKRSTDFGEQKITWDKVKKCYNF